VSTSVSSLVVACGRGACREGRRKYEGTQSSTSFSIYGFNNGFAAHIIGTFVTYDIRGERAGDSVCVGSKCLPGINGGHLSFGCLRTCPAEFQKQVPDGILGLAPESLMNFLVSFHKMKQRVFSMCIGKNTGALAFGGVMPQVSSAML
jgi:hypothetical protein